MKKLAKIAAAAGSALTGLTLFATKVAAQYDYDWDYSYGTTDATSGFLGLGLSLLCWIPICIVSIVTLIFTVLMIIDVSKRDESVLPKKTMWMVLMAVGIFVGGWGFIVALYYYFARKRKLDAMAK